MNKDPKQVVSMLVSEAKLTLFTIVGEVLEITAEGPYDTTGISEFLTPKLDGKSVVDIELSDYLAVANALSSPEYEEEGVVVTHEINGESVQGIFYPQKISVEVTTKETGTVKIPHVENLEKHIKRASDDNSPAVRNFLKRLAPVVKDRLHSAEDLMAFIKRSDMPLTDSGLIIGYKRVNQKGEDYVDCHTGNITQRVGDIVWMDVDGVDPDRNRSCSHGLHVANLGYLSGFGASHTLMVLVDPKDFIAVPHREETKCRVSAYTIIGVLSDTSHKTVSRSFVNDDVSFEDLVSRTVQGETPEILRKVKVGQRRVEEIQQYTATETVSEEIVAKKSSTKASGKSLETETIPEKAKQKELLSMAKTSKNQSTEAWASAPPEVIKAFDLMINNPEMTKTALAQKFDTSTRTIGRWSEKYNFEGYQVSKEKTMTLAQRAVAMFKAGQFAALRELKKAKKKSWTALGGFTESQVKKIESA